MKVLSSPLYELAEVCSAAEDIKKKNTPIHISGCIDTQKCHLIDTLGSGFRFRVIITYSDAKAKELYDDLKFYDAKDMKEEMDEFVKKQSGKSKKYGKTETNR